MTNNGHTAAPETARDAALFYHSRGIGVVPLSTRSKDPGFAGWPDFRFDPAKIDTHFPEGAERNIASLNGVPSDRLADVDLDCDEARRAAPLLLPGTKWVFGRESAPSSHYLFRTDLPFASASREFVDPVFEPRGGEKKAMICELRGTNGISVLPPSRHKETGEAIHWEVLEGEPAEVSLKLLTQRVEDVAVVALLARYWPARGNRDACFMALAGGLVRVLDVARAERILDALVAVTDDEEGPDRVRKAQRAAGRIEAADPTVGWPKLAELLGERGGVVVRQVRTWLGVVDPASSGSASWPDPIPLGEPLGVPAFPSDSLPAELNDFARSLAEATQTPLDLAGVLALVQSGAALAGKCEVQIRPGWIEPMNLFGVVVLPPGERKSAVFREVSAPVYDFERAEQERMAPVIAGLQSEHRQIEARLKHLEGKVAKAEGDERSNLEAEAIRLAKELAAHIVPAEPRYICDDITPEKLASLLAEQGGRMLQAGPEGTLFEIAKGRYSDSGTANFEVYLKGHAGDPLRVDRSGRGSNHADAPALSVALAVQPDVISGLAAKGSLRHRGFLARFLYAVPSSLVGRRRVAAGPVPEAVRAKFRECMLRLWRMPDLGEDGGRRRPHRIVFSLEADRALRELEAWLEPRLAEGGDLHYLAGWANKLAGACARIAGILHIVGGNEPNEPVGAEATWAAIRLGKEYFLGHAQAAFHLLGAAEKHDQAAKLWQVIRAKVAHVVDVAPRVCVTRRELFSWTRRTFRTVDLMDPVIEVLVDHYLLRPEGEGQRGRGHKGPTYQVNPRALQDTVPPAQRPQRTQPPPDDDVSDEGVSGCVIGSAGEPSRAQRTHCAQPDDGGGDVGASAPRAQRPQRTQHPDAVAEVAHGVDVAHARLRAEKLDDGEPRPKGVGESCPDYRLVATPSELATVADAVEGSSMVGLDVETTGLDPRSDRVRLLSLACDTIDGGAFCYVVDCFEVDPAPLWERVAEKELIGHNLTFDLSFLERLGFVPSGKISDLMHLSRILHAGEGHQVKHGLADVALRHLGVPLDKTEQKSNWSGMLTASQLAYAARDALILRPLLDALLPKLEGAGLVQTADIESRCVPAVAWMSGKGVAVDRGAWEALVRRATTEAEELSRQMADIAPVAPGEMFASWNWASPTDMVRLFRALDFEVKSSDDGTLAGIDHPLAGLLRKYREATKLTSTYGAEWLRWVRADGRVYAKWNQTGTVSGRMSCGEPNLQQIPRSKAYRRCFAAPPGRDLIKADYSQLELRIAAKISGDEAMIAAYRDGIDIHTQTAQKVLGKSEVTKEDRQIAKALNFGLLYGMGAQTFRANAKAEYGLDLTLEQATQYREAFFATYRGLRKWHRSQPEGSVTTRTLSGRLRANVERFTEKLNTPVQGTGGDGVKLALALLWERRDQVPGAFPVMAIHDEIVVECTGDQSEAAAAWVRQAMVDAMAELLDPVPVEVEVKVGRTWGEG